MRIACASPKCSSCISSRTRLQTDHRLNSRMDWRNRLIQGWAYDALVRHGMINPEDLKLFSFTDEPAAVLGLLKGYHDNVSVLATEIRCTPATESTVTFLALRFYRTMDLSGDEFAQPIENLNPLYRLAQENGLRLEADVGIPTRDA
jgi:hypothetical protein